MTRRPFRLLAVLGWALLLTCGSAMFAQAGHAAPGGYDLWINVGGTPSGSPGSTVTVTLTWGNAGPGHSPRPDFVTYVAPNRTMIVAGPSDWTVGGRTAQHIDDSGLSRGKTRNAVLTLRIGPDAPRGRTLTGGFARVFGAAPGPGDVNPGNNSAGSAVKVIGPTSSPSPTTTRPSPTSQSPSPSTTPSTTPSSASPTQTPSQTFTLITPSGFTTSPSTEDTASTEATDATDPATADPTTSAPATTAAVAASSDSGGGTSGTDIAVAIGAGVGAVGVAGGVVALVTARKRAQARAYGGDFPGSVPFQPYQPPE